MKPYFANDFVELYHGDSCEIVPQLPGSFDLVFTDPPYSSGGFSRADRNLSTTAKYRLADVQKANPDFTGDNRDQRSLEKWFTLWLTAAYKKMRPGGACICFIDWRNIAVMIDAVQIAGWVYRAIVPWDKTLASRPNKGWFRNQCEFMVCSTAGPIVRADTLSATGQKIEGLGRCSPGCFKCPTVQGKKKLHLTEKPLALLTEVMATRDDWQRVLDPFAGSGSTLEAAAMMGRKAVGIEISEQYCEIAAKRLQQHIILVLG